LNTCRACSGQCKGWVAIGCIQHSRVLKGASHMEQFNADLGLDNHDSASNNPPR
jgi:hypothetical protein